MLLGIENVDEPVMGTDGVMEVIGDSGFEVSECVEEVVRRSVKRVSRETTSLRRAGVAVGLAATRGAGVAGIGVACAILFCAGTGEGLGETLAILVRGSAEPVFGCGEGDGVALVERSAIRDFLGVESGAWVLAGDEIVDGACATLFCAAAGEGLGEALATFVEVVFEDGLAGDGVSLAVRSAMRDFFGVSSGACVLEGDGVVAGPCAMLFSAGAGVLFGVSVSDGCGSAGRKPSVRLSEKCFLFAGFGAAFGSADLPTCALSHSRRLARSSPEAALPGASVCPIASVIGAKRATARREWKCTLPKSRNFIWGRWRGDIAGLSRSAKVFPGVLLTLCYTTSTLKLNAEPLAVSPRESCSDFSFPVAGPIL